jgi:hypothetical protein
MSFLINEKFDADDDDDIDSGIKLEGRKRIPALLQRLIIFSTLSSFHHDNN